VAIFSGHLIGRIWLLIGSFPLTAELKSQSNYKLCGLQVQVIPNCFANFILSTRASKHKRMSTLNTTEASKDDVPLRTSMALLPTHTPNSETCTQISDTSGLTLQAVSLVSLCCICVGISLDLLVFIIYLTSRSVFVFSITSGRSFETDTK